MPYDLVIANGRVIDPASGLDAICYLGIQAGRIRTIRFEDNLQGRDRVDARGLIVAPGFIDLNAHSVEGEACRLQALDGVTTTLSLEIGTSDVENWYAERAGNMLLNYGVSAGHVPIRSLALEGAPRLFSTGDGAYRTARPDEIRRICRRIERELARGALAVGFAIQYTPAATTEEICACFQIASRFGAPCYVHLRYQGQQAPGSVDALQEILEVASASSVALHIAHIPGSGLSATARLLKMLTEANLAGLDVTADFFPYTAGMTGIQSALFDDGWQERLGITYQDLQWVETGERLDAEHFDRYRQAGGGVIFHAIPEEAVQQAMHNRLCMVATDGFIRNGKGHPRLAGSHARILGRYVRQSGELNWMEALRKMTWLPAWRFQNYLPALENKGCIRVGADADLVVFDPGRVLDQATYAEPERPSVGFQHVIVNGNLIVRHGQLQPGVLPGLPVRA